MSSAALPTGADVRTVEPYVVQAWMYGVLAVAFFSFFWPTLYALHGRWSSLDEAYAHGYLIVGLAVYFLWLQRERLRHAQAESEHRWLPALAALAAAWSTAQIVGVELAGELVLPLLAVVAVYVLAGRAVAAIVAFPLAMIYVGVPIWEDLFGTPLRKATTFVTYNLLDSFAPYPVHLSDYTLSFPGGGIVVADSCSGLSFFLTSITIGLAFGYLNFDSVARRAGYLLLCVALGILSNWVRVTSLAVIGEYTQMQSTLFTESHFMFGWYMFAAAMVLMLWIGNRMSDPLPAEAPTTEVPDSGHGQSATSRTAVTTLVLTILAMAIGPAISWGVQSLPMRAVPAPNTPAGFVHVDADVTPWHGYFQSSAQVTTAVWGDDPAVQLTLAHYPAQTQGNEVVYYQNRLDDEEAWTIAENGSPPTDVVRSLPHAVSETTLRSAGNQKLLVWHWNQMGPYTSLGRVRSKVAQLRSMLVDRRSDGNFVALSLTCEEDCTSARARLSELAPKLMQAVDAELK